VFVLCPADMKNVVDAPMSDGVYGYVPEDGAVPITVAAVNPAACPEMVLAARVIFSPVVWVTLFPYLSVLVTAIPLPRSNDVDVMLI